MYVCACAYGHIRPLSSGSSEVCRQCMECGVKYGQRKRTRELVAWTKKKRKHIRRDELLAFLLDKPHPDPTAVADLAEELGDLPAPPLTSTCSTRGSCTPEAAPCLD